MKSKQLSEILEKFDLIIAKQLIDNKEWDKLREFLNSIDSKLKKKGLLPDYLYYVLVANFK